LEWFECKVLNATSNLLQWFEVFIHKRTSTLDHKSGGLVGKSFMVGEIHKEFFKEKVETSTMDGRKHSKPYHPN
jgi:hypothetical protein